MLFSRPDFFRFFGFWICCLFAPFCAFSLRGADLDESRKAFIEGNYTNCIRLSEEAIRDNEYDEEWRLLLANSLFTIGKYPEAFNVVSNSLTRYSSSIRLRLLAFEIYPYNGEAERARELLQEINQLAGSRTWAYRDPPNLVALGEAALLLGADPRLVLEKVFDQAKKSDPDYRGTYLASGDVALEKHDYALAAKSFEAALKKHPNDPDLHFGLARAYAPSDRRRMIRSLETALRHNKNHLPSLLWFADHLIDSEDYDAAVEMLDKVIAVNPWQPEAWSYRAILKHLESDAKGEKDAREKALRFWATNPRVDHLIGQKLSQKYRFAEGAASQRQALRFDEAYSPAQVQLAQDLLRLGEEDEGWRLADQAYKKDAYDVVTYNLVTLRDTIEKFQTLTNDDFILRMAPREASIYGQKVLALLARAKTNLCGKYGLQLEKPTIVEIFPEQKDFGVRTFGMPDNPGFLGVCFGSVITANSPASQGGNPANWEAVLWHEFCHVVTLQMTRNRMPRWLSEGISVYEEMQANPSWGQSMNPNYRDMILGDELTPVGDLSAAFLAPKTPMHLQFAYFESSLVVEFIIKQFGLDALKNILRDLGRGVEINKALVSHTAPLDKIEVDFAKFATDRANKLAPGLDWEKPKGRPLLSDSAISNSTNFWILSNEAKKLLAEKKWQEAKGPLKRLIEFYPTQTAAENAYVLLAEAHRALNETESERQVLEKLASMDSDATEVFLRLTELSASAKDWSGLEKNARRFLAVNPLVPQPHRYLAQACEKLDRKKEAIESLEVLLLLEPPDPADVHYRLACLLQGIDISLARRHLLDSLQEAPRFRDAHRLLFEMSSTAKAEQEKKP